MQGTKIMNVKSPLAAAIVASAFSVTAISLAHAQSYPSRPIKLVLPFTAGSPNGVPARTVPEFVAYAKANPGKLNFGFGQGTQPHLVGELFKIATGTDIVNVPYRGGAQAVTDMLGGRIHMNIGTFATLAPQVREG